MNLGASAIVIRPRTTVEVLDLACRLLATAARGLYLRLAALVLLPCFAACMWLRYSAGWTWLAVWIVAMALGSIAQGVFTIAAGRLIFSESLTARSVLRIFAGRLPWYLGALLWSRILLAILSIVLPWIWIRVLFLHEVSLLEGAGSFQSIQRSGRFTRGRGAALFVVLCALLAAQAGVIVAAELLGDGILDGLLQLGKPFGSLFKDGGSAAALLGYLISVPYVATARFLYYIDMRTRSDGWDIQLRFMAIAARETEERRAA